MSVRPPVSHTYKRIMKKGRNGHGIVMNEPVKQGNRVGTAKGNLGAAD